MLPLKEVSGYAIDWIFGALIVAGIAQGKNRSGLNWFVLAALLSPPLALFILVAFYDRKKKGK